MNKERYSNPSLKAVEQLQRPPLTDIKERLKLFADEMKDDVTGVLLVTYPQCITHGFGKSMTASEAAGTLLFAAHGLAELCSDKKDGAA